MPRTPRYFEVASFKCEPELLAWLDERATARKTTRSEIIRNALLAARARQIADADARRAEIKGATK